MAAKKITKDQIIDLIADEAYVIKRRADIFSELKSFNEELKTLNENRGLAGTFGFKNPNDCMNKSANGTGFKNPQDISHIAQLEKEMGGFGDEFQEKAIHETEIQALKQENEQLKKQLEEMTAVKTTQTSSETPTPTAK